MTLSRVTEQVIPGLLVASHSLPANLENTQVKDPEVAMLGSITCTLSPILTLVISVLASSPF